MGRAGTSIVIRRVRPEEADAAGQIVVRAFEAIPGPHMDGGYAAELADVAGRMAVSEVLVAVDEATTSETSVVGCVTFVADQDSPLAEEVMEGECQIRMMAVAPASRGRGVGQLLLDAALERATELGRQAVFLHSTPAMTAAHRLYQRNGFVRVPNRDWTPEPGLLLIAFCLNLCDT